MKKKIVQEKIYPMTQNIPNKFFAGTLFLALVAIMLFTSACGAVANEAAAAPQAEGDAATPATTAVLVPVEVAPAENGNISLLLNYSGNLAAQSDVTVVPRVGGQVKEVVVAVGDTVKAGDPIAIIDSDIYQAQLKQAEGALDQAKLTLQQMEEGARPEQLAAARASVDIARAALADVKNPNADTRTTAAASLAQAQAAVRLAQAEYDKVAWAGQVGQLPQALQLEKATTSYEAALAGYKLQTNPSASKTAALEGQVVKSELDLQLAETPFRPVEFDRARAVIQQAEGVVEQARLQLQYATLTAPVSGVIAELYLDQGEMVGNSSPVARVVSNEVEAQLSVEEGRYGQVEKGQPVSLRVAAYPGVDFPAIVTTVAPLADAKTHTFAVTVTPLDKKGLLRSGMFADTTLLAEEKQNTLLVPLTAVTTVNDTPTVYVINADGVAEQRAVTTGLSNQTQIEILSGVKIGENVVTAGQVNLQDGITVKVVPQL
jgi:RND family efflux transporter MFP subunit